MVPVAAVSAVLTWAGVGAATVTAVAAVASFADFFGAIPELKSLDRKIPQRRLTATKVALEGTNASILTFGDIYASQPTHRLTFPVRGDCLAPLIRDCSWVTVDTAAPVETGDLALIEGAAPPLQGRMLKYVEITEDGSRYAYDALGECHRIAGITRIVGKAVAAVVPYEGFAFDTSLPAVESITAGAKPRNTSNV
jgi:hypothetical protein